MKSEPTFYVNIWIAGDLATAKQACREYCRVGLCVTITPTDYVYTGGAEEGVLVRLINYPRFPSTQHELEKRAGELAEFLRTRLCQDSYCLETPERTYWFSSRAP